MTLSEKLDEYRKATVAGLVALFAILGFIITFDPGLQTAAIAVTLGVFNVAGVAMSKNHTADDLSKAVMALVASAIGLVSLFVVVDVNTVETIGAIALAIVNVYGVYTATNKPVRKRSRMPQ